MRFFRRCRHDRVRCVHGDEIIALKFRRSVCLDCRRSFDPLPAVCSLTGFPHTAGAESRQLHPFFDLLWPAGRPRRPGAR